MQNKKLAFLPLIALLGLAGCDVTVTPTNYNDPIVTIDDGAKSKNVYHNISNIIQDAYHDGSMASDVCDKVLYEYAVSIFGRYNKATKGYKADSNEVTLKDAVRDSYNPSSHPIADAFIKGHKAYWTTNSKGERVDASGQPYTGEAAQESEIDRLQSRWLAIEDLIAEQMYSKIKGSYSDRSYFYEEDFVTSLRDSGEAVKAKADGEVFYSGLLSPYVDKSDVFSEGYLHREYYQANYNASEQETADQKVKYIEEKLIPGIYNTLMVNQYLLDKKFNALGASYARKVNIIAVKKNEDAPRYDDYFVNSLIEEINTNPGEIDPLDPSYNPEIDPSINVNTGRALLPDDLFESYSKAWNGLYDDEANQTNTILQRISDATNNTIFKYDTTYTSDHYYEGTSYGNLVKDYRKLDGLYTADWKKVDTSVVSDFTNSGKYSKEIGKEVKTRDIELTSHVTDGWYISNGGLSSLPSSITSRLFSFTVATAFSEWDQTRDIQDRWQHDDVTGWTYSEANDTSTYLARINDVYYLKKDSASQGSDPKNDILFYDASSSTYYVVQVLEAVNTTKLQDATRVGDYEHYTDNKEEIITEVSKAVAASESYTTLAKKYWLEQMSLTYHDTTVYDYFVANYPELFED